MRNETITMEMMNFAKDVALAVNGEVVIREKANGVQKVGIQPKERKGNAVPCYYIDSAFKKGFTVAEVVKLYDEVISHSATDIDANFVYDLEKVKPLLRCGLFNKATNKEVFVSARGYGYSDLIICPSILVNDIKGVGVGSIWVTNHMLEFWGVDVKELVKIGLENEKLYMKGLSQVMAELMGQEIPDCFEPDDFLFVVSNESKVNGAISVIAHRKELMKKFPNGYVVLPSSVNEVLVMDINRYDPALIEMVKEINGTEVAPEEILADNVYVIRPRRK